MRISSREVEKMFMEDVREKKRTGSGSFHKTGKGVKHTMHGVKLGPYDFMKPKEKKKLNGEVRCYNMYETIIPVEEFKLKDEATQKAMLTRWRELYSNAKIMTEMGVRGNAAFSKLIHGLGIEKKQRGGTVRASRKPKEQTQTQLSLPMVQEAPIQPAQPVRLIVNGLHLEYSGVYDANQLNKIFTKLQLLTDGEENKFTVNISISEQA